MLFRCRCHLVPVAFPPGVFMANRAFTLIELLIVVAIIAILAAIAVPNFLEAQTRSKIARAKADMRTLATAVEAYAVDNNKYPYAQSVTNLPWLAPGGSPLLHTGGDQVGGLTSPIAYLTTLPEDVFKHPIGNGVFVDAPLYYEKPGFGYINGVRTTIPTYVPNDALHHYMKIDGTDYATTYIYDERNAPTRWVIYSIGPDLELELMDLNTGVELTNSRFHLDNRYDATNGSISAGNILRYPGGLSFP